MVKTIAGVGRLRAKRGTGACVFLAATSALALSLYVSSLERVSPWATVIRRDRLHGMRGPLPWDQLTGESRREFLMNGTIPLEKYYLSHDAFDAAKAAEPAAPWTDATIHDLRLRAAAGQDLNGYCGAGRYLTRAFSKVRLHGVCVCTRVRLRAWACVRVCLRVHTCVLIVPR